MITKQVLKFIGNQSYHPPIFKNVQFEKDVTE